MDADRRLRDVWNVCADSANKVAILLGYRITRRIRNINDRCPRFDHCLKHLEQIRRVGPSRILSVELYVIDIRFSQFYGIDSHCKNVPALLFERAAVSLIAELAHHVNVGSTDPGVDTSTL